MNNLITTLKNNFDKMNDTQMKTKSEGQEAATKRPKSLLFKILAFVGPVAVLALGVIAANYLMDSGPQPKRKNNRPVQTTMVRVQKVQFAPQQISVSAMGEVIASKEVDIRSRVKGEVLGVKDKLEKGAFFLEGEILFQIDTADYKLAILQAESEVIKAKANRSLEKGNQMVAEKEFEFLGEEASEEEKALMLRVPQLREKEALVMAAEAKLKGAQLNLARTDVQAPMNGVVLSKSVEKGSLVSESSSLLRVAGTDSFRVELTVPVEKLKWLYLPGPDGKPGSKVIVFSRGKSENEQRKGIITELSADLEENGRLAKLLVEVEDPLLLKPENSDLSRLFLGSYIEAEIEGRKLDSVFALERKYMRDGETIWILSEDSTLEIRKIAPVFKNKKYVYLSDDIKEKEKVIISSIATPVDGMRLEPEGGDSGTGGKKGKGQMGMKKKQGQTSE